MGWWQERPTVSIIVWGFYTWGEIEFWVLEKALQRNFQETLNSSAWDWPHSCNILEDQGLARDLFLVKAEQDSYLSLGTDNCWPYSLSHPSLRDVVAETSDCSLNHETDWLCCSFCSSPFLPMKHLLFQGSAQTLCMAELHQHHHFSAFQCHLGHNLCHCIGIAYLLFVSPK